jgi:hypothetical protein
MRKLHLPVLTIVALLAVPGASFANHWTSVCSIGAIDEADRSQYAVQGASLFFAPGQQGTIVARYNVTNTSTSTDTPAYTTLELGYGGDVIGFALTATLYEVDPCTGGRAAICTVFSLGSVTGTCETCTFPNTTFNFAAHLYYVEVTIKSENSNPTANTLRIY